MKILVIKRDKLGDLLLATPMLHHLRASLPNVEIHLLANDYNAWVVDGNADIDQRWIYRRVRHAGRTSVKAAVEQIFLSFLLRRQRFDWVIVANGEESPRAIRRGVSAGGKRCVAVCSNVAAYPRLSHGLPVRRDLHEIDRMLLMLEPLNVKPPIEPLLPTYVLPNESSSFADEWLQKRGLAKDAYVVVGLGARRAKKQPSTEQILRWCKRFKSVWGLDTVFMWTPGASNDPLYPGDDAVAQPVVDARISYIHPFRGPLTEALGLIWNAKTSVFPDSGLMHFAAASHGGVLGLFAETEISPSPVQWAPRGRRASYLEAAKSVEELPDDLVFEKIAGLLP
jgi:ADP-heptose:LPS heptosyltransferase